MKVIYAQEEIPKLFTKAIFLAGPSPRDLDILSWRPEAIRLLALLNYDGIVFNPEFRDREKAAREGFVRDKQIEWEEIALNMADCITFWVPRVLKGMPAFTTNDEWGVWKNLGKVVFGAPDYAEKVEYQQYYANKLGIKPHNNLVEVLKEAVDMVGEGAFRENGERYVPVFIWNKSEFKNWYSSLKQAGNRLDKAKVVWSFWIENGVKVAFFWALHVDVYIAKEDRHKINEVVLSRPDIATIVMYKLGKTLEETEIVLIREFRSPVSNETGYVLEIPGGSSFKPVGDPVLLAADECHEETGLKVDASRIVMHNIRQMVSTLSAHKAHLFSVEITEKELAWLKAQQGIAHGVEADTERTYVEIMKLRDILDQSLVDWSMLGMILSVVR